MSDGQPQSLSGPSSGPARAATHATISYHKQMSPCLNMATSHPPPHACLCPVSIAAVHERVVAESARVGMDSRCLARVRNGNVTV